MTEFWMNLLWTCFVAVAIMLANILATTLVRQKRAISAIRKVLSNSSGRVVGAKQLRDEIESISRNSSVIWGAELATVSLSLDFAALSIWMNKPEIFPFFQHFNELNASREIAVWLILFLGHFVILLLVLFLKQHHNVVMENYNLARNGWWRKNLYMIAANFLGFISLLIIFSILSNGTWG